MEVIPYEPMLASGTKSYDLATLGASGAWTFECKVDGVRAIVAAEPGQVRIWGRGGHEMTRSFPEVVASIAATVTTPFVLDAELELIGQELGEATLADLLARSTSPRGALRLAQVNPAWVVAFDLLEVNGVQQLDRALVDRQRALSALLDTMGCPALNVVRSSPDGAELAALTRAQGREGIIAKKLSSLYTPGRRSRSWVKFKNTHEITCVGFGYTAGNRAGFGALRIAVIKDGQAVPVGLVGSGFSESAITLCRNALTAGTFPLVRITCLGISSGGSLRQPVFTALATTGIESASADQLATLPVST